jgi:glycosyltransferase involved in cell wall biosynthesis
MTTPSPMRPVHGAVVGAQLAAERALDALARASGPAVAAGRLTVVVKTHERPRIVRRLVRSIRRLHPDVAIVVVDDSLAPAAPEGAELIALAPGSGVSAGRQAGLDAVTTEFVAVFDDDFVLTRHSALGRAVETLDRHPEIDIVGGRVVNLPRYRSIAYPRAEDGRTAGGLPVHAKVATFYVARSERLRLVGWDPAIKRLDHADFFARADGVLLTVLDASMRCLHARTPFDREYMRSRHELEADRVLLRRRWS